MSTRLIAAALLAATTFTSTAALAESSVVYLDDDQGPVATVIIDGVDLEGVELSAESLDLTTFGANIDSFFLTISAERDGYDIELGDLSIPAEIIDPAAMQEELEMGGFSSEIAVNINQGHRGVDELAVNINQGHYGVDELAVNINQGHLVVNTSAPVETATGTEIAVNINQGY